MRLLRVGPTGGERPVVLQGDTAYDVSDLVGDYDAEFWSNGGAENLPLAMARRRTKLPQVNLDSVRIGPPVPTPGKVICIGLNYADHIRESGADTPSEPVIFMKAPNTVAGPNDDVLIPPGSDKTDYEIELAVVVGRTCRYASDEAAAFQAIAGYTISNDLSERSYQLERGGQWVKGKSCETFNPLGPYLAIRDFVSDPQNLDLTLKVNDEIRQQSNTSEMVFAVAHIVWYLTQFMVLDPGDVINTGTPPGVALGMSPPRYLNPGDVIEASIHGLGTQRQICRQATP